MKSESEGDASAPADAGIRPIQTKNCATSGRSRPSLARISATSCDVAAAPAMIAAGSPGVSRSIANTSTATIAMTGTVAARRRARKVSIGALLATDGASQRLCSPGRRTAIALQLRLAALPRCAENR